MGVRRLDHAQIRGAEAIARQPGGMIVGELPARLSAFGGVRLLSGIEIRVLAGPQPSEGSRGEQGVDEAVEGFLDDHAPRLALPDAVAKISEAIGEERGDGDHSKDHRIGSAGRNGVSSEAGDENADNQAIGEPQAEEFRQGRSATGKYRQEAYWALLKFLLDGG
jgi:hypothetical protein